MTVDDLLFFLLQCGILFLSALICTMVGFGFGIFANSLMLLAGMTLPQAMPISVTTMSAQTAVSIYHLRAHGMFARVRWVIFTTLLFMPLGTLLLHYLSETMSKESLRAIVGGIILLVVTLQTAARVKPRERVHWGWGLAAASSGGVLAGLCGMGGPPLVLWVIAHQWSSQQTRVALWTIFLSLVPAQVLLITLAFGIEPVYKGVLTGLVALPLVMAGTVLGMKLGNRMSKPLLQAVARVLLVLIALAMIGLWYFFYAK